MNILLTCIKFLSKVHFMYIKTRKQQGKQGEMYIKRPKICKRVTMEDCSEWEDREILSAAKDSLRRQAVFT